jgi:hypothetical protein
LERIICFVIPNWKTIYRYAETRGYIKYLSCHQAAKNSSFSKAVNFLFLAAVTFSITEVRSVAACFTEQQ